MRKRLISILAAVLVLMLCIPSGLADKSEGDQYTFCPYISTLFYNGMIQSLLELDDSTAALIQVTSDGVKDGNLVYSNILNETIFIFGGTTSEFGTATNAYIYCSLKDDSVLKNIPMIVWASQIQYKYYGNLDETGSTFLEWVNGNRKDGATFSTPYFQARYSEEPHEYCTLLLLKK